MLKIKDNVDLKELEKFGFVLCHKQYLKRIFPRVGWSISYYICVEEKTREIFIECNGDLDDLDIIYDLIKADLVEKVED